MPKRRVRYIILIIRVSHDLTLVALIWIICRPRQNIDGVFTSKKKIARLAFRSESEVSQVGFALLLGISWHSLAILYSRLPPCRWRNAHKAGKR
jgi:hypothetical protein